MTARNVLSNWGGQLFSLVSAFVVSPYIVRKLGGSGYGVWSLMMAVTSYMALLDLGVRGAALRYIARHHAQGNDEEASRIASCGMAIFASGAVFTVLCSAGLAAFVDRLFRIPADLVPAARPVLLAAGLSVGLSLAGGIYSSVLAALQRFDRLNGIEVTIGVGRTILMVIVLAAGGGLIGMAGVLAACATLRFTWLLVDSRRLYPALGIDLRLATRSNFRLIFGYSTSSFLLNVGDRLIYFTDSVVVGALLPIANVALFGIASTLTDATRMLAGGISQTLSPLASSLDARSEHDSIRRMLLTATKLCSVLCLPVLVTFIIRGPAFITLWMGPAYGPSSGRILQILTIALLFTTGYHPAGGVLLGIDRHRPLAPLMLGEGLVNLGLSVVLLQVMGIEGVAWGTTLPRLLTAFFFWPPYLRWAVGIPIREFVRETWLRPFTGVAPFALATWLVERTIPTPSLVLFALQTAALLPLAAIAAWFACCSREERIVLRTAAAAMLARMRVRSTTALKAA